MGEMVCPRCGEPLGVELDEGTCSRCGAYIMLHRQTGAPVVVEAENRPWWQLPPSLFICAGGIALATVGFFLPWTSDTSGVAGAGVYLLIPLAIGVLVLFGYSVVRVFTVLGIALAGITLLIVGWFTISMAQADIAPQSGLYLVLAGAAIWLAGAIARPFQG